MIGHILASLGLVDAYVRTSRTTRSSSSSAGSFVWAIIVVAAIILCVIGQAVYHKRRYGRYNFWVRNNHGPHVVSRPPYSNQGMPSAGQQPYPQQQTYPPPQYPVSQYPPQVYQPNVQPYQEYPPPQASQQQQPYQYGDGSNIVYKM